MKTIVEAVIENAENMPEKLALCFKTEKLTYLELSDYVKKAAYILSENYNVCSGDMVMVSALSKPEFVVVLLGAQYLGATVIPLDKAMTEQNLVRMYNFVEPHVFFTDSRISDETVKKCSLKVFYQMVKDNKSVCADYQQPDEEAIAEIIFTTGTTGNPKGAMLSYKNIYAGTIHTKDGVRIKSDDIELIPLPLNHSFGLRVLRTILYVGATAVLQNGFMFIKETIKNIETFSCNSMCIVPASMEKLQRNLGQEFSTIFGGFDFIEISAGSLSVAAKQRTLELLPNTIIYNVWGSSETGGVIFLNVTENTSHIAALGCVADDVEVRFLDAGGNDVAGDSIETAGRMILKGDMQMKGYLNMPELSAETIKGGFLQTSDLAYRTEDGFIYMLGRVDDIINVGGEKVSPIEIEDIACLYKQIEECACIGGIDKTGEFEKIPVLFVVTKGTIFDENDFLSFLSNKLEQYKLPKQVVYINSLPRNSMKKVDRNKLRKMWEDNSFEDTNPVINAIYGRRSVRNFKEEHIPKEILEEIVACGYQAPSGHNMQTWKFTVITNKKEILRLKEVIPDIAKENGVYFYGFNNPDTLILVSNDIRNQYGVQDSSCAILNIMLAAHSLGIGSVWINALMKICDVKEIRQILDEYKIPKNHNVWGMVALGYPANAPSPLAKRKNVVEWIE